MTEDAAKEALKRMAYGFYGITTREDDQVNAMVANWVTQVSFEPRMIAMGLQKTSHTYGLISRGRVFAVNIFDKDSAEALKPYSKGRSKNPDKMKDAQFKEAPETGCPILDGAAAYVECKVVDIFDTGGDHNIVLGEVVGAGIETPGEVDDTLALADVGWSYAG